MEEYMSDGDYIELFRCVWKLTFGNNPINVHQFWEFKCDFNEIHRGVVSGDNLVLMGVITDIPHGLFGEHKYELTGE